MAWKEEAIVDCTMDTLRDSRETYECTTSDRLRDQISVLHLFVLFGWLFVAVCTFPSSSRRCDFTRHVFQMCIIALVIGVSKRIRGQSFRDIPRNKLPVDVVAAQSSSLSKVMRHGPRCRLQSRNPAVGCRKWPVPCCPSFLGPALAQLSFHRH